MRYLPVLASGPARWRLPMAGRSADLLAEMALAGPSTARIAQLAQQLALDPPLALWAVCSDPGRTLAALAEWLAAHAVAALSGSEAADPPDQFSALVIDSLFAAEALRAQSPGLQPSTSEPFLAALVHNSSQWLARCALSTTPPTPDFQLPTSDLQLPNSEFRIPNSQQSLAAWLAPGALSNEMLSLLAAKLGRLAELEASMAALVEREKLDAMAEFAAGAGHEINNPLAVIAGRAQLFLREEKDPERRRGLALINAQAMRVYEMIADMRLFARPPELQPQPVDLAALVDRVLEELGPRAAEQETQLARTGDPAPLELSADPVQLAVALKALGANALEALGLGGRIEFELSRHQGETRIRVTDDGPGIAPEDLPRIFDPYFSARQAGRGLGMGLAKCWRIVTAHGGQIDVESRPGQGARFTIRLRSSPAETRE